MGQLSVADGRAAAAGLTRVRTRRGIPLLLCAALAVAVAVSPAAGIPAAAAATTTPVASQHPRLLFSAKDVPALRARVAAGGVPGAAWQKLRERAEGHLAKVSPDVVRANVGVPATLQGLEKPYTLQNEMPTYLIDLGLAYQVSGDKRFGRHAIELLSALGDAGFPYWCCQDLGVGDLGEGLGLAFDWTYELMTPEERQKIIGDMTKHEALLFERPLLKPTHPAARYPTSNWMGVTAGGAGLAILALRGEPGAPARTEEYLDAAVHWTGTYLKASGDLTGANMEGHQYAFYGMKNAIPFALAARRAGFPDLIRGTGLENQATWLSFEQLPGDGQNFVPLNDSGRSSYGVDMFALQFAIAPDNGVAQWLWQRTVGELGNDFYGSQPVPDHALEGKCTQNRVEEAPVTTIACPIFNLHGNAFAILFYRSPEETPEVDPATVSPLSVHHVKRGLMDARTGFSGGENEVISTFEAHRDGEAHFQYDVGNFTLYGEGGRFAIDPGTSCVACGNNDDAGFAIAHNVIVVDNKKETQYRFLRYFTGTTIDSFVNTGTLSLTHADLRYAYSFESPIADRDHIFGRSPGRPVLVGIGDSLQRDKIPFEKANPNDHTYTWQMLTQYENEVVTSGSGFTITAPNGATLVGRAALDGSDDADPVVQQRFYRYSHLSDDMPGAQVVFTTTPPRQRFDQLTVLALTPAGEPPATQETLRVTGGNALAVDWKDGRDVIVRRLALSDGVTGPVATDATMAKYTRDTGDTVLRDGTHLVGEGREYVRVTGAASTVTVSGRTATATGKGTSFRVLAPQPLSTTTVNGGKVASCRSGAYVTFPCGAARAEAPATVRPASEQLPRTGVPAARGSTTTAPERLRALPVALDAPVAPGIAALLLLLVTASAALTRSRRNE